MASGDNPKSSSQLQFSLCYPFLVCLLIFASSSTTTTGISSTHGHTTNQTLCLRCSKASTTIAPKQKEIRRIRRVEEGLARARAAIRDAAVRRRTICSNKNNNESNFIPTGPIYTNPFSFHQSQIEMRKRFKVWVYKEGEIPMFQRGPLKDIYGIEGQFMDELESNSQFLARNPDEATVFFIPVSVAYAVRYLYEPIGYYQRHLLQTVVTDYIGIVSKRYPYWNTSNGADHFYIACHDWGPDVSAASPELYKNVIRVLCNANTSEGFQPARDATLPEIKIPVETLELPCFGEKPTNRPILAFFAGGHHGYVRNLLFHYWKNKDDDVQVHDYLPENVDYFELMGRTKFCLCPSGWEVASPRVIESIYSGCVPVIISDNYVLPFSDVLNWSKFSVHIPVDKIPDIKKILQEVSYNEYQKQQKLVMQVHRHFRIHRPARPFDLLDMVFHSIWLRRLNVKIS